MDPDKGDEMLNQIPQEYFFEKVLTPCMTRDIFLDWEVSMLPTIKKVLEKVDHSKTFNISVKLCEPLFRQ